MTLSYRDLKDEASERTVWPFALGYFEQVRVLVAWCGCVRAFATFGSIASHGCSRKIAAIPKAESLLKEWRTTQQIPQPKFIADRN